MMLIIFRLYDHHYGPEGNKKTLSVYLKDDNTLGYTLYGGWQDSGMGFAIGNLQLRESLPMSIALFANVNLLASRISRILGTGVGSHDIKSFEILNKLPNETKAEAKKQTKKRIEELMAEARALINKDDAQPKEILKVLNELEDYLKEKK